MKKVKFYKLMRKSRPQPAYGYQYDYDGVTFFLDNRGYPGHPSYYVTEKSTGLEVMDSEAYLTTISQAQEYARKIVEVVKKNLYSVDYTEYKNIIAKAYKEDEQ